MMTFKALKGKMEVKVINAQGQTVIKIQIQAYQGVDNGHIHFGDLSPEIYTLLCILNDGKETHQVIFK